MRSDFSSFAPSISQPHLRVARWLSCIGTKEGRKERRKKGTTERRKAGRLSSTGVVNWFSDLQQKV